MATGDLTLYTAKTCPFAQRVELALAEAGVPATKYEIDTSNKPEWYVAQVNPAGKVPALAYGGPKVSPESPSPLSNKLVESLVLLEFLADLHPKTHLLPSTPVARAQARAFIATASGNVIPTFFAFVLGGTELGAVLGALKDLQALLPQEGGFALGGQWSIADAAVAPFLGRLELMLRHDVGNYAEGTGRRAYGEIFEEKAFARLQQYLRDIKSRPSWPATFDEDFTLKDLQRRFARRDYAVA